MKTYQYTISIDSIINRDPSFYQKAKEFKEIDFCENETVKSYPSFLYTNPNYGRITEPYLYFTIEIPNHFDDIGLYHSEDFIQFTGFTDDNIIICETDDYSNKFPFDTHPNFRRPTTNNDIYWTAESDRFSVSGNTTSRLNEIDFYDSTIVEGKNYGDENGFDGVIGTTARTFKYTINGGVENDSYVYKSGVELTQYTDQTTLIFDPVTNSFKEVPLVNFMYYIRGYTEDLFSIQQPVKNPNLYGITHIEDTVSNLQFGRPTYSVFQNHYVLGEINSFEDLRNYKNNIYNLQQP
jgi:hypothetical protein